VWLPGFGNHGNYNNIFLFIVVFLVYYCIAARRLCLVGREIIHGKGDFGCCLSEMGG